MRVIFISAREENYKQRGKERKRTKTTKKGMSPVMVIWNWSCWCDLKIYG